MTYVNNKLSRGGGFQCTDFEGGGASFQRARAEGGGQDFSAWDPENSSTPRYSRYTLIMTTP